MASVCDSEFDPELGNVKNWIKQTEINKALGLQQNYPVFRCWRPKQNLELIEAIRGFALRWTPVMLRQIYYHLVSIQSLPEARNSEQGKKHYNLVKDLVKRMRLAGIIPFSAIVDEGRHAERSGVWHGIEEVERAVLEQYRSPWIENQATYVEVFVEKQSLRNFFYPVTNSYGVYLNVGKGYTSWDMIYTAAQRFKEAMSRAQEIRILYFGDLNASGKDMIRDIRKRFQTLGVSDVDDWIEECALLERDIEHYNLPLNPEKLGDSRSKWFAEKYPTVKGSVELDALPPEALRERLRLNIIRHLEIDKLVADQEQDRLDLARLKELLEPFFKQLRERESLG
jgi:hypothetical protein